MTEYNDSVLKARVAIATLSLAQFTEEIKNILMSSGTFDAEISMRVVEDIDRLYSSLTELGLSALDLTDEELQEKIRELGL